MAAELITIKPRLDKLNTQLVFIGSGTPAQAARFQKSLKEQVDCYVDQKCEVYKKLGCIQASLKVLLGTQSMKSYSRALLKGFMNTTVQGMCTSLMFQLNEKVMENS